MKALAPLLLVLTVSAAGCKPSARDSKAEGFGTRAVSLKGTYGIRRGAEIEPVIKIEEAKSGGYVFEERVTGEWVPDGEPPHIATEVEVSRSFHGPIGAPVYGLSTAKAAVYKLPEGWSQGRFRTATGYVLIEGAGPIELVKMLRE